MISEFIANGWFDPVILKPDNPSPPGGQLEKPLMQNMTDFNAERHRVDELDLAESTEPTRPWGPTLGDVPTFTGRSFETGY